VKRKTTLRTVGLVALCLLLGGVLLGVLAAEEQATVPTVMGKKDLAFLWLADQLKPIIVAHHVPPPPELYASFAEVIKDGRKVAEIFIDPRWLGVKTPPEMITAARALDDGDFIGAARSYDGIVPLSCTAEIPPREYYYVWMANADTIGLKPPIRMELHWFIALVNFILGADGKVDIKDIAAIAFYPDKEFRTPEQWLGKGIPDAIIYGCPPPPPRPEPVPPPPPPPPTSPPVT